MALGGTPLLNRKLSNNIEQTPSSSTAAIAIHIPDNESLATGLVFNSKGLQMHKGLLDIGGKCRQPNYRWSCRIVCIPCCLRGVRYLPTTQASVRIVAYEQHGEDAVRIPQLMLDVGKMDEKQPRSPRIAAIKPFNKDHVTQWR